jgi:hypothetical protein
MTSNLVLQSVSSVISAMESYIEDLDHYSDSVRRRCRINTAGDNRTDLVVVNPLFSVRCVVGDLGLAVFDCNRRLKAFLRSVSADSASSQPERPHKPEYVGVWGDNACCDGPNQRLAKKGNAGGRRQLNPGHCGVAFISQRSQLIRDQFGISGWRSNVGRVWSGLSAIRRSNHCTSYSAYIRHRNFDDNFARTKLKHRRHAAKDCKLLWKLLRLAL